MFYSNVAFKAKQQTKKTQKKNSSTKTNKIVTVSLLSMIDDDIKIKLLFRYDQEI